MASDQTQDRRRGQRFPLHLELRWRNVSNQKEGEGQTIDISSTGALFGSRQELGRIGDTLELFIRWPMKMDRQVPLKLVAFARVVRCEEDKIAVEIERYEFRLEGALNLNPRKKPESASSQAAFSVPQIPFRVFSSHKRRHPPLRVAAGASLKT